MATMPVTQTNAVAIERNAAKRQLFLTEQGYRYTIMRAEDIGG